MLTLQVPEALTAMYIVPVERSVPHLDALVSEQVALRLSEPLRGMVLQMLGSPLLTVDVRGAAELPPVPAEALRTFGGTDSQVAAVEHAAWALVVQAVFRPGWPPVHEWVARGVAVVLAEALGSPVLDTLGPRVVDADVFRRSLPQSDGSTRLVDWVLVPQSAGAHGFWFTTLGLTRFGLPELQTRNVPPQLAGAWTQALSGVARAVLVRWLDNVAGEPAFVELPDVLDVGEADVAAAYGADPGQADAEARAPVRLELEIDDRTAFLTVLPPLEAGGSAGEYVANVCAALFGAPDPDIRQVARDDAMEQAMATARRYLPEARRRFQAGDLPPQALLMVKHRVSTEEGDEYPWAYVTAWDRRETVLATSAADVDTDPSVRAGRPIVLAQEDLVDWAVWIEGEGVIEGGWTNAVLTGEPPPPPPRRSRWDRLRRR